jgi:dTDP-4-amino-4,6-dideoxygalactose transaminase
MSIPFSRPTSVGKESEYMCQAVFHYLPLHPSPMGEKYGGKVGDCAVTERISDQLLRLPFYTNMTEDEQKNVIAALKEFSVS